MLHFVIIRGSPAFKKQSQHYKVEKFVIYGSRAKGTYKNGSDIDFAIWTKGGNIAQIEAELEDLPTPYMFDVTDYNTLSHENLKKSIDIDGIEFYKRTN